MPNIAVIGLGNWGQHLARIFYQLESLAICCDLDEKKLSKFTKHFHGVDFTKSFDDVVNNEKIDGIVIASPAVFHYELAKKALSKGKSVFIEKPMTLNSKDGEDLVKIARHQGVPLMVGHLLKYHPAIIKVKELIDQGDLGDIYYLYSQRVNLGTIRKDENALWSFAPHDISVALYLLGDNIESISARGECYIQNGIEDVVFLNMRYKNKLMVNIQISWLDPYKERKFTIVGSKKMVAFDDMQSTEKIKIYDKGVSREPGYESYGDSLTLRFGDIHIPKIDMSEPLKLECQHFIECVKHKKKPHTDGSEGVKVVKILEKAQESLKKNGVPININL